jgi:hypothetical protein
MPFDDYLDESDGALEVPDESDQPEESAAETVTDFMDAVVDYAQENEYDDLADALEDYADAHPDEWEAVEDLGVDFTDILEDYAESFGAGELEWEGYDDRDWGEWEDLMWDENTTDMDIDGKYGSTS